VDQAVPGRKSRRLCLELGEAAEVFRAPFVEPRLSSLMRDLPSVDVVRECFRRRFVHLER